MFIACNLFVFLLTLWSKPAYAFIELDNQFVAREACEALQSIRSGTNPKYSVDSPKTYPVIGKTKIALHYLRIEGAERQLAGYLYSVDNFRFFCSSRTGLFTCPQLATFFVKRSCV